MAQRTLHIDQPLEQVWTQLQLLSIWEGIGGMHDLRNGVHRSDGTLQRFSFSLETPIGTIHDDADVTPGKDPAVRSMHVRTETKGIRVTITIELTEPTASSTAASLDIAAAATSFLSRPLASALGHTLESGIDREGQRMLDRVNG